LLKILEVSELFLYEKSMFFPKKSLKVSIDYNVLRLC